MNILVMNFMEQQEDLLVEELTENIGLDCAHSDAIGLLTILSTYVSVCLWWSHECECPFVGRVCLFREFSLEKGSASHT